MLIKMPVHSEKYQIDMGYLNEDWAQKNHRQSLTRLAQRGGLSRFEIYCNIKQIPLTTKFASEQEENKAVNKEVAHLLESR